jgi:hypothetical protein
MRVSRCHINTRGVNIPILMRIRKNILRGELPDVHAKVGWESRWVFFTTGGGAGVRLTQLHNYVKTNRVINTFESTLLVSAPNAGLVILHYV